MIGLYELLGNPTTQLIEPPGPSAANKEINKESYPLRNICVTNDYGYVPFIIITISSPPVFHEFHVVQSLVFCVETRVLFHVCTFVDHCLSS